jgi:murein DD-endopeptidase MepM/ murein hydrolase activator NlpD
MSLIKKHHKKKIAAAVFVVFVFSIGLGWLMTEGAIERPLVTATGQVMQHPWVIKVEGKEVAILSGEEAARLTIEGIKKQYVCEENKILFLKFKEKVRIERLDADNGCDTPGLFTIDEAIERLTEGKDPLTVISGELCEDIRITKCKTIRKNVTSLEAGTEKVKKNGCSGKTEIKTKIIKENGKVVSKEIIEKNVLTKASSRVILVGTAGADLKNTGSGEFGRPLSSMNIISGFGPRGGAFHDGIDIGAGYGTSIYASQSGYVLQAGESGYGWGIIVKVRHRNGMTTIYAHCRSVDVRAGQSVKRGQKIAEVGSSGNASSPHLHFEIWRGSSLSTAVDPMKYL